MFVGHDGVVMSSKQAESLARRLLAADTPRLRHVMAVVSSAAGLFGRRTDLEGLVTAAWVHDIGYAEDLRLTGCHHLDGAVHLRSLGEEKLAGLVAYHSSGPWEVELRGLEVCFSTFTSPDPLLLTALSWCDLTTGPNGERLGIDERLADVVRRYGESNVVSQALATAVPLIGADFRRDLLDSVDDR